MKRIISAVLCLALAMGMTAVLSVSGLAGSQLYVGGNNNGTGSWYATLSGASAAIKASGEGSYIVAVIGDTSETAVSTFESGCSVTMLGTGTIKRANGYEGDIISVNSGASVSLGPLTVDGGGFDSTGRLLAVYGGTAVIDGATLKNNKGGGALVASGGTLTVEDGVISGNGSSSVFGGGVQIMDSGFVMNGGEISRNSAQFGGGLNIWGVSSAASVSDGSICGNSAVLGGGVNIYRGSFTVSGGYISENSAASNGGGICNSAYIHSAVSSSDNTVGRVYISGGEISGNTSSGKGDGVYLNYSDFYRTVEENGSSVTVHTIISNKLELSGDALIAMNNDVYLAKHTVRVSDTVRCEGDNNAYVTVSGSLSHTPAAVITPYDYVEGITVAPGGDTLAVTQTEGAQVAVSGGKLVLKSIYDSQLTPVSAEFDKAAPADVSVAVALNGNTLTGIRRGSISLAPGDYSFENDTVTVFAEYFSALDFYEYNLPLTFIFSAGDPQTLIVRMKDGSAYLKECGVLPAAADYARGTGHISVSLPASVYDFTGVSVGALELRTGPEAADANISGYTTELQDALVGGVLTEVEAKAYTYCIYKSFLDTLPYGTSTVTFVRSDGSDWKLSLNVVPMGDMDFDGELTVSDALRVLRFAARLVEPDSDEKAIADMDSDGSVTVSDALRVLRIAAGLV